MVRKWSGQSRKDSNPTPVSPKALSPKKKKIKKALQYITYVLTT